YVHRSIYFSEWPRSAAAASARRPGRIRTSGLAGLLQQSRAINHRRHANRCQYHGDDCELYGRVGALYRPNNTPLRRRPGVLGSSDLSHARRKSWTAAGGDGSRRGRRLRRGWCDRGLQRRDDKIVLAGRACQLMAGPRFLARNVLTALATCEFYFRHIIGGPGTGKPPTNQWSRLKRQF